MYRAESGRRAPKSAVWCIAKQGIASSCPTVCRNVARVTRLAERVSGDETSGERSPLGIEVLTLPRESATVAAQPPSSAGAPIARAPGADPSFEELSREPPRAEMPLAPAPLALPDKLAPDVLAAPAEPAGGAGSETPVPQALPLLADAVPALPPDVLIAPAPVPEPGAWLMLLAGLGVWALLSRRRVGRD